MVVGRERQRERDRELKIEPQHFLHIIAAAAAVTSAGRRDGSEQQNLKEINHFCHIRFSICICNSTNIRAKYGHKNACEYQKKQKKLLLAEIVEEGNEMQSLLSLFKKLFVCPRNMRYVMQ